ncbi:hypothetical protein BDN72DRAFT_507552 [Pluteus cervinus]|uniref:Uncharacterized protein n=1 Tax=Pluteus cervinus TaxID=181527 RepID=A0ACD3A4N4_9AGAR|nr:hypothetical protein BDN72DRAFT_507552 [Pluteus cervinus]
MFTRLMTDVLMMAGWGGEAEMLNFPNRLSRLIDITIALNKVIMQKVFSMQVKLMGVPAMTLFDPTMMEDDRAEVLDTRRDDTKAGDQIHVLCTTSLGLEFTLVDHQATSNFTTQAEYALKPKVITSSIFNERD